MASATLQSRTGASPVEASIAADAADILDARGKIVRHGAFEFVDNFTRIRGLDAEAVSQRDGARGQAPGPGPLGALTGPKPCATSQVLTPARRPPRGAGQTPGRRQCEPYHHASAGKPAG